ncbi:hypothetical protein Tco_0338559 [Tanacetum coccineum]
MAAGVWGSDDGDGHEGGVMVAAVERAAVFRPESSPENFSGDGGMVAGGGRREGGRKFGEDGGGRECYSSGVCWEIQV